MPSSIDKTLVGPIPNFIALQILKRLEVSFIVPFTLSEIWPLVPRLKICLFYFSVTYVFLSVWDFH
jgi:hypothetical protein